MSSEVEDLRELATLLNRISKRLYTIRFLVYATMYLSWCIWLTTIIILAIIASVFKLPDWVFFAYYIPSLIATIILSQVKIPSMFKFLGELVKLSSFDTRECLSESKIKRANLLINTVWITGFSLIGILGYFYGDVGASTGLLLAVGIGNLTIYLTLWIYAKIYLKGGLILSIILLLTAGLNVLLHMYQAGYEWLFTTSAILLVYLLMAFYIIVISLK